MKKTHSAFVTLAATALACGSVALLSPGTELSASTARSPQGKKPLKIVEAARNDADLRVTPVVKAVRRSADSVVSIYVIRRDHLRSFGRMRADGQGSGVIFDASGMVITNWHVAAAAAGRGSSYVLRVRLKNDKSYGAQVLSTSARYDLALLQLELPPGEKVKPAVLGDSDSLMIGETVIAIGNPRGNANSVTVGVLSAKNRTIRVRTPDGAVREYSGLLQTDAAINQGNSGGALLDITGKLIGINNAMAVDAENIGFAIPVNTVKRAFQDALLSSESLASVWLGMKVHDGKGGALVTNVDPLGPAARAGVRTGDVILEAGGNPVGSALDYARTMLRARAGQAFPLRVRRRDRVHRVRAVPLSTAAWEILRRAGLEVEAVSAQQDRRLVENATREFYAGSRYQRVPLLPVAIRVQGVRPDSPAEELGLQPGDVLLGITEYSFWGARNLPFNSLDDLADKLRDHAGSKLPLLVLRDGEGLTGELPVGR